MTKHKPPHPELARFEDADGVIDARRERIWDVACNRQKGLMVLMEDIENAFNLNAIARTCDAMGIQEVGFTTPKSLSVNPLEDGVIASRSASKWMTYRYYEQGTEATLRQLKQEGWHILATVADEGASVLYETDLTDPQLVVLVGNERQGISPIAQRYADTKVVIPMVGMVQSLNVSVATSLVLYEILAQRRAKGGFLYSEAEALALAQEMIQRSSEPKKRA